MVPVATALPSAPPGRMTRTGVARYVCAPCVPMPSWPNWAVPQVQTAPPAGTATLGSWAAAREHNGGPGRQADLRGSEHRGVRGPARAGLTEEVPAPGQHLPARGQGQSVVAA